MKERDKLGELLEAFVNRVSHPRGRALKLTTEASVTVPQVILLDLTRKSPNCTPSDLAAAMKISLPSVSQMIDRLVKQDLLQRTEDNRDRRCKALKITPKAKTFLERQRVVRCAEYAAGTAGLSQSTRELLAAALSKALDEFESDLRG